MEIQRINQDASDPLEPDDLVRMVSDDGVEEVVLAGLVLTDDGALIPNLPDGIGTNLAGAPYITLRGVIHQLPKE